MLRALGVCKFVPVTITVELDVLHCELMAVTQCVGAWQQVSCFSFGHGTVCLCASVCTCLCVHVCLCTCLLVVGLGTV